MTFTLQIKPCRGPSCPREGGAICAHTTCRRPLGRAGCYVRSCRVSVSLSGGPVHVLRVASRHRGADPLSCGPLPSLSTSSLDQCHEMSSHAPSPPYLRSSGAVAGLSSGLWQCLLDQQGSGHSPSTVPGWGQLRQTASSTRKDGLLPAGGCHQAGCRVGGAALPRAAPVWVRSFAGQVGGSVSSPMFLSQFLRSFRGVTQPTPW